MKVNPPKATDEATSAENFSQSLPPLLAVRALCALAAPPSTPKRSSRSCMIRSMLAMPAATRLVATFTTLDEAVRLTKAISAITLADYSVADALAVFKGEKRLRAVSRIRVQSKGKLVRKVPATDLLFYARRFVFDVRDGIQKGTCMPYVSHSVEETQQLARAISERVQPGDVILLVGIWARAKPTSRKASLRDSSLPEVPTSPTFNLVCEYHDGRLPLYHFDLYRLEEQKSSKISTITALPKAMACRL